MTRTISVDIDLARAWTDGIFSAVVPTVPGAWDVGLTFRKDGAQQARVLSRLYEPM